jgi:hypothetical protein
VWVGGWGVCVCGGVCVGVFDLHLTEI